MLFRSKSRTWSRKDAEHKAALTTELMSLLGVADSPTVTEDYIELIRKQKAAA